MNDFEKLLTNMVTQTKEIVGVIKSLVKEVSALKYRVDELEKREREGVPIKTKVVE